MPLDQMTHGETRTTAYPRNSWWQRRRTWTRAIAIPLATGFTGMTILLIGLRIAPLPDESLASPTAINSADGTHLASWTIKGAEYNQIPLSRIPLDLQHATLAVEDADFYRHHAFNPTSLLRAFVVDLRHGRIEEGGSTITQQLAKNLYLSQDRTLTRKAREALYAMQLELHESKQTILNQYLNVVYYGNGAYGVGAAAELYFHKPVNQLSLAESSMLAGLPKGPSLYSPIAHFAAAKERQALVLGRMVTAGYLTQAAADIAYHTTLKINTLHTQVQKAPYFTVTAIQEVEHRFHLSADDLYRGDTSITTTLDPLLQKAAERAVATSIPKGSGLQAAVVALDPRTGAIKALVGGRDFESSPYNRVFAERQPGSTFKAILYTAALEHGWTPARQVSSAPTTFQYGTNAALYNVHDYEDLYANRPLTMREAIARSDNVYAVTTNLAVGPQAVVDVAHDMGLTSNLSPYPSLALGVFPTSPLEMATAYATLANGGYRVTPYTVSEVRAAEKGKVYQTEPTHTRVVSPQVAYQMTDLLTSVLQPHGTGYAVHQYLHNIAAAKTGTTDTDVWMVGYTPNIVCAVWVGYDNNRPLGNADAHLAGPIWAKFMGTAQAHSPTSWYSAPAGLVKRTIDPLTAQLATDTCGATQTDYYAEGTEPTQFCALHPATQAPKPPRLKRGLLPWLRKWL